ncbi:NHL repeat-containing protein 2-like [Argonauta hians]
MADLNDVLEICCDLEEKLADILVQSERQKIIRKHLTLMTSKYKFTVPDFPSDCDWLNSAPLSLTNQLNGKVVVLDFFTYCCMNCLHVLPDLELLEETYSVEDGVAVIGVHSAKFDNEKVLENVRSAVLRHGITHPVVNDPQAFLWSELIVACWPTFVVLGPNGEYLRSFAGEGNRQKLLEFIEVTLEYFRGTGHVKPHSLPIRLEKNRAVNGSGKDYTDNGGDIRDGIGSSSSSSSSGGDGHAEDEDKDVLRFPGKLCVDTAEGRSMLYISDSGHHRILGCDLATGIVKTVIGGPEKGFQDGTFQTARFNNPQGLAIIQQTLYVADCDNHSVRKIDLSSNEVTTIAGTGVQGSDKEGGRIGPQQELCSPYDLLLVPSVIYGDLDVLLIAMAGSHQIWAYFLQNTDWFHHSQYVSGTCVSVAGTGLEENRNDASDPSKAGFAQLSGLAYCSTLHTVYIADSESSSVRSFNLKSQAVQPVVGASNNPTCLFAYGDVDGVGVSAKLQHPLGITMLCDPTEGKPLAVLADTYNHKIKCIDVMEMSCSTLIGCGQPGNLITADPLQSLLREPTDVAVDTTTQRLYIADSNNHCIKLFDSKTSLLSHFPLKLPKQKDLVTGKPHCSNKTFCRITPKKTKAQLLETLYLRPSCQLTFQLDVHLTTEGVSLNQEATSTWQIFTEDDTSKQLLKKVYKSKGNVEHLNNQVLVEVSLPDIEPCTSLPPRQLHLECLIYTCSVKGVCNMAPLLFTQPVTISNNGLDQYSVILKHSI